MNTEDGKVQAFRDMLMRMSERDLVARLKAATFMAAVDAEFTRRLKPELIEEGNAKLIELGGVSSTEDLLTILREELNARSIAKGGTA